MSALMLLLLANLLPLQAQGPLQVEPPIAYETNLFDGPRNVVFCGKDCSHPMVTIDMQAGKITYGPDYTPDAAAKIFWETIGKETPCKVKTK